MAESPVHAGRQLAAARRKARHFAVQALYQWAMSGTAPGAIDTQFREEFDFRGADHEYFQALLHGVTGVAPELEDCMRPYLDIPVEKLGPVELAILRIATWELRERLDVQWRVVIDEAVALARKFGATDSHRFVNAVLDRVARELRPAETQRAT